MIQFLSNLHKRIRNHFMDTSTHMNLKKAVEFTKVWHTEHHECDYDKCQADLCIKTREIENWLKQELLWA